ncbi:MAG: hypothetical protein MJZ31_05440 [Bacteroidales bacterium]|nr:hypothetical protein [Bacteroidales bacterium]
MSYIGIIGATHIEEQKPDLLLLDNYKLAQSMLAGSADALSIKIATGWEMGVDKLWRYEIDDPFFDTATIEEHVKRHFGESINIRLCMRDTMILTAYPEFHRLKLYAMYSPKKGLAGYFNPNNYGMVVSLGTVNSPFEYQIEGILLHEIQHLIQSIEGFARGGSCAQGKRYHILAGEVEARNICHRHNLTSEERRNNLRTATQDVPDDMQIIKK